MRAISSSVGTKSEARRASLTPGSSATWAKVLSQNCDSSFERPCILAFSSRDGGGGRRIDGLRPSLGELCEEVVGQNDLGAAAFGRLADAEIGGHHGQVLGIRMRGDELLDTFVGVLVVDREDDRQSFVSSMRRAITRRVGGIENHGRLMGIDGGQSGDQFGKETVPSLTQPLGPELPFHEPLGMHHVVAVDERTHWKYRTRDGIVRTGGWRATPLVYHRGTRQP